MVRDITEIRGSRRYNRFNRSHIVYAQRTATVTNPEDRIPKFDTLLLLLLSQFRGPYHLSSSDVHIQAKHFG